jgi:hypothetical protein
MQNAKCKMQTGKQDVLRNIGGEGRSVVPYRFFD